MAASLRLRLKSSNVRELKKVAAFVFIACAVFFPQLFSTNSYDGRVVGVTDGDTLALLTEGNSPMKIRLADIDTPEFDQPYGSRAKQELSELAFNKAARALVEDTDKYGRKVARVFVGDVNVNAEMVRRGAAWVYRDYARDISLFALEDEAWRAKRGLWALPESERIPPWEWRHKAAKREDGKGGAVR